ncbi:DsbA family protein [Patescibacteria group bacterium]
MNKKMEEEKIKDVSVEEMIEDFDDSMEGCECKNDKFKNLVALCILLGGLFLGSLFIDLYQVVQGGGFSKKVLDNEEVFSIEDKTWVAYSEPIVKLEVVNDENCEECNVDETLVLLKKLIPTVLTEKIDYDSKIGENVVSEMKLKSVPAFVFSKDIEETEFFSQAQPIFMEYGDKYVLNTAQLGLPVGKYIELPGVDEDSIKYGSDDAAVRLVQFSDFQCPYCKTYHSVVRKIVDEYGDDLQFVFKQLPLESIHPMARDAAMASECANEQGMFMEYADKLFARQDEWGASANIQIFKNYAAQVGLNSEQFNVCLDESKYSEKIDADMAEADAFGVSGTPAIFVNDQFRGGVLQEDMLKSMIDEALGSGEEGEEIEEILETE